MFIQILAGLLTANILEWVVHKYFLHNLGKKKASLFSFHWGVHHKMVRKSGFKDPFVSRREIIGILFLCLLFSPLTYFFPIIYATMFLHAMVYLVIHNTAHRNPKWAFKYVRWHYDHHMGKDQDKNWCVVHPLADYLFRTRRKYEYRK